MQHTLAILMLLALLAGCASAPSPPAEEAVKIVWPPEPAEPRVVFVKQFSGAADFGIRPDFVSRLRGFFTGAEETKLIKPMAVLATADEVYYVADPGHRGIHKFNVPGGSYSLIRAEDDAPLPSPVGMAAADDGSVFVADSYLGKVLVIRPGSEVAVEVKLERPPGQPTGVAIDDATGSIYVVDTASHHVLRYAMNGRLLGTIGARGKGSGQLNYPTMTWMTSDRKLLVTDSMNFRINAYDVDGKFAYSFGQHGDGSGDLSRPKGVATDNLGHVYLTDGMFHAFQVFDNSGKFLLTVGNSGRGAGEFLLPTGIFISEDNTIYICDSQNQRVQVFRYIGG